MSNDITPEDLKIKLTGSGNWVQWKSIFETKARALNLWKSIDPEASDRVPFLAAPEVPTFDEPQGVQTRGGGGLSDIEKFRMEMYKINDRKYESQLKAIASMKNWVMATVEPSLRQACCLPGSDLQEWFEALQDSAGMDENLARAHATRAYQMFMTPTQRAPKDLIKWVTEFEAIMLEAQTLKVPNACDAHLWYDALEDVTRPFLGFQLQMWRSQLSTEIDNNKLSSRKVAQKIRYEISREVALKPAQRGVKRPAAFPAGTNDEGLTLDEESSDHTPPKKAKKEKGRSNRRGKQKNNLKNNHTKDWGKETRKTCRACGQFHDLSKCFYIFKR
ncbi:hypothetical protein CDV31_016854 [Fusarium ambrosium]|uniref:Uncharacterized protein n=1 Tax=Fusarium ambrosium TaxID=131363 RepID=A0A428S0M2_9HYPO|nr:hypothetical protein CDV31_016854 [Fusarium ambrosium]